MKIIWQTDINRGIKVKPSVKAIIGRDKYRISNSDITLINMKPGETRFIRIDYPIPGNKEGEMFPVSFSEMKNGPVINGFTVARESSKTENVISQNVHYEALVFRRISKLYNISGVETIRKTDLDFVERKRLSMDEYRILFGINFPIIKSVVKELLKNAGNDPFDLVATLTQSESLLKNKKNAELMSVHLSLLNSIDAFLTSLQLEKGNNADYLQTVYLQKNVIELLQTKKVLDHMDNVLSVTNKFIELAENRKLSIENYPEHVEIILPILKTVIEKLTNNTELKKSLDKMERNLKNVTGLQKEHINFLLLLRKTANNLK